MQDINTIQELRPFQLTISSQFARPINPQIQWVADSGNTGKTELIKRLAKNENATIILSGDIKKIVMRFCNNIDYPNARPTVFRLDACQMPKTKDDITKVYSIIEQIKDGLLDIPYDDKILVFNASNVWIFANFFPIRSHLPSNYKWKFWTVNKNYELVSLNIESHKGSLLFSEQGM